MADEIERRITMLEVKVDHMQREVRDEKELHREITRKLDRLITENAVRSAGLSKYDRAVIYSGIFGSIIIALAEVIVHL